MSGYVVVTFGGPDIEGRCALANCPMHAHGPYGTLEEAQAIRDRIDDWMEPHVLALADDGDACLR